MSDPAETRAAILAIGSEMLGPLRQDTNSLWLTARLEEIGIPVVRKSIVGDDPAVIVRELETASCEASLLISTGGLGPTADDVTTAAVARWLEALWSGTRTSSRACGPGSKRAASGCRP